MKEQYRTTDSEVCNVSNIGNYLSIRGGKETPLSVTTVKTNLGKNIL